MLRRAAGALLLVWTVASAAFLLTALTPGDAAQATAFFGSTPAGIAALRAEAGLDDPLPVQYARWLGRAVRGDLGKSFQYRAPVGPMVADRATQ